MKRFIFILIIPFLLALILCNVGIVKTSTDDTERKFLDFNYELVYDDGLKYYTTLQGGETYYVNPLYVCPSTDYFNCCLGNSYDYHNMVGGVCITANDDGSWGVGFDGMSSIGVDISFDDDKSMYKISFESTVTFDTSSEDAILPDVFSLFFQISPTSSLRFPLDSTLGSFFSQKIFLSFSRLLDHVPYDSILSVVSNNHYILFCIVYVGLIFDFIIFYILYKGLYLLFNLIPFKERD